MYLATPGSRFCEYGQSVSKHECENAGKNFFPNPPRNLQLGSGCIGGWKNVPVGCSVEAKGDGSAHYKTTEDANCPIIQECCQEYISLKRYYLQIGIEQSGKLPKTKHHLFVIVGKFHTM